MNQEQRIETHGWIAYDYQQDDRIINGLGRHRRCCASSCEGITGASGTCQFHHTPQRQKY